MSDVTYTWGYNIGYGFGFAAPFLLPSYLSDTNLGQCQAKGRRKKMRTYPLSLTSLIPPVTEEIFSFMF